MGVSMNSILVFNVYYWAIVYFPVRLPAYTDKLNLFSTHFLKIK